jgi:hypothetical protein
VVLGCYTIRRLINGFLLPESHYVTSDHERKVALYGASLEVLHTLFQHLGADK